MAILHPRQLSLLDAIRSQLDDDTPRLVYADWLDEHGDSARAEFIRTQCESARLAPNDPRRAALEARAAELEKAHAEEWLGPLRESLDRVVGRGERKSWRFRRGFLYRARLRPRWQGFLRAASDCLTCEPLEELSLVVVRKQNLEKLLAEVAASPQLDCLRSLSWSGSRPMGVEDVKLLDSSPYLKRLTELDPSHCLSGFTLRALAATSLGQRLTSLRGEAQSGEEIAVRNTFTQAPGFPSLRRLSWRNAALNADGLRRLGTSPLLGQLSELSLLGEPELGPKGMSHLVKSPLWARLTRLEMHYCSIDEEGGGTLFEALPRAALKQLTLMRCGLTGAGVKSLVEVPSWGSLEELDLQYSQLGDTGVIALAGSRHLAQLQVLALPQCGLREEGARALIASPYLEGLRRLQLFEFQLPRGAKPALKKRFGQRLHFEIVSATD